MTNNKNIRVQKSYFLQPSGLCFEFTQDKAVNPYNYHARDPYKKQQGAAPNTMVS